MLGTILNLVDAGETGHHVLRAIAGTLRGARGLAEGGEAAGGIRRDMLVRADAALYAARAAGRNRVLIDG